MKEYYVLLTGSINNAGDFLIRERSLNLLRWLRPDRTLLPVDRWRPIDDNLLEEINQSRAVILAGGPALRQNMYPEIYPLRASLDDIRAPIVTMGIGWKSKRGDWQDSRDYPLSPRTQTLLQKTAASGVQSSVRDYHSLNVLARHGFTHFVMSGCPSLYHPDFIGCDYPNPSEARSVSFSLGVTFLNSAAMERQTYQLLENLAARFSPASITVVFHHAVDGGAKASPVAVAGHRRVIDWLQRSGIGHVDISGSAEAMVAHYQQCDFHIGYRVHAHILMCSLSRPSLLLAEDGRGKALSRVLGASVVDAFDDYRGCNVARRLLGVNEPYVVAPQLAAEVAEMMDYELTNQAPRLRQSRLLIDSHFKAMKRFVEQLP